MSVRVKEEEREREIKRDLEGTTQLHGGGIWYHIDSKLRSLEQQLQHLALFPYC